MPLLRRTLRGATLAVSVCTALLLVSCGSDVTPRAIPADDDGVITSSSPSTSSPSTSKPKSTPPNQDGDGDVDIDVEIGECVELGGTATDATIDNSTCGSPESNYKVIAKAPTNLDCIADADQTYYELFADIEQGALCLDIDWVVDGCMEMSGENPQRADCDTVGRQTVKVTEFLDGTTDPNDCADPATSGYYHTERNFIVCVEDL
ncbi:hypothetical protein QMK17_14850 [Rhodococcus sp. G-MC3]|uniref:LppU family putative lipoprotein n=1 Tax=Rhodococcus sp. G-MC3 TaxID=3046209 RepID=UPI0024B961A0|nr:hypothetical protein [Rhodococcus sp. G-MC3]MDJ0394600.1 hypothetical protein [Rhodococcus sp. G-MC3]